MSGRNCGRGAGSFGTFLEVLASLKEVRQVTEARAVSSGAELAPYHAFALDASPPHLPALLDTNIAWWAWDPTAWNRRPKRKISCLEGMCSPEPPKRQLTKALPLQILLAFSLEVKAAKGVEDKW